MNRLLQCAVLVCLAAGCSDAAPAQSWNQAVPFHDHSVVALRQDGTVWFWRRSGEGPQQPAEQLGTRRDWVTLTVIPDRRVLGLTTDGSVWSWDIEGGSSTPLPEPRLIDSGPGTRYIWRDLVVREDSSLWQTNDQQPWPGQFLGTGWSEACDAFVGLAADGSFKCEHQQGPGGAFCQTEGVQQVSCTPDGAAALTESGVVHRLKLPEDLAPIEGPATSVGVDCLTLEAGGVLASLFFGDAAIAEGTEGRAWKWCYSSLIAVADNGQAFYRGTEIRDQ